MVRSKAKKPSEIYLEPRTVTHETLKWPEIADDNMPVLEYDNGEQAPVDVPPPSASALATDDDVPMEALQSTATPPRHATPLPPSTPCADSAITPPHISTPLPASSHASSPAPDIEIKPPTSPAGPSEVPTFAAIGQSGTEDVHMDETAVMTLIDDLPGAMSSLTTLRMYISIYIMCI